MRLTYKYRPGDLLLSATPHTNRMVEFSFVQTQSSTCSWVVMTRHKHLSCREVRSGELSALTSWRASSCEILTYFMSVFSDVFSRVVFRN